ncbi:hypothetical protein NDI47_18045, partial [Microcoleus vaginatus GB1-A2]|uniref:hypothetical protein n=1 Tax=Microcoleus vaginatus TaxID=119532 RepID=UPI001A7E468F
FWGHIYSVYRIVSDFYSLINLLVIFLSIYTYCKTGMLPVQSLSSRFPFARKYQRWLPKTQRKWSAFMSH